MTTNAETRPTPLRALRATVTVRLETTEGKIRPVAEVSETVDTNAPELLGQQVSWITGTAAAVYARACAVAAAKEGR